MITLHYYPGNASFTPHVLLHEIGAPFELQLVDRARGEHKSAAYLALNPNGQIPVLVDGDLVLYETAAICLHLVDTHPAAGLAPAVGSVSGALAFAVSLLCIQAKLGFVPFDVAEAETEIIAGAYVEYSGAPLAVFKLTQAMLLVTLPVFLSAVFLGGLVFAGWGILWSILKIVGIIVLVIVIKNTNPRVRIDQAVRFFWRGLAPLAAVALVLALVGRATGIGWL